MNATSERAQTTPAIADACRTCPQRSDCFLAHPLPSEDEQCAGVVRRHHPLLRDERLFRRGSAFHSVYIVCAGSLKTQRETPDGDLVITGFYFPGDIVGIGAIADGAFPCDALATSAAQVCQLDFGRLLSRCAGNPGLHQWVISRISMYHRRRDRDLCWSTGLPANRRILRFFLDLHERLTSAAGARQPSCALPMRKQDIARYLHITPETLSRNLAQLRRQGLLLIDQDRFIVPDTSRATHLTQL